MTDDDKPRPNSRPLTGKAPRRTSTAARTAAAKTAREELAALFEEARPQERIAKRLARAGLCSRRDAERWIEEGRVSVDGTVLTSPAFNVGETSVIVIDGKELPTIEPPRLWRYHKPRGLLTTAKDPEGRATIFDKLPADLPRVISVGRLDYDSEGLLLLTNDGALARYLELPTTGWARRYRVRVYGAIDEDALKALKRGVTIDGVEYGGIEVAVDKASRTNSWLTVTIREGKNREIRRVMEHLGLSVSRLLRVSYGPFQLGDIEPGAAEEVKRAVLKGQLGIDDADRTGTAKAKPGRTGTKPPSAKKTIKLKGKDGRPVLSLDGKSKPETQRTDSKNKGGSGADRRRKPSRD